MRIYGDRFVFEVKVFEGDKEASQEQVFIPVDDASLLNAQLSKALNDYSYPGLEARREKKARAKRGW